jgi:hypothetical protein
MVADLGLLTVFPELVATRLALASPPAGIPSAL